MMRGHAPRRSSASRLPAGLLTPLSTWFPDDRALDRFRERRLGRMPVALRARAIHWRSVAPGLGAVQALAAAGSPFQVTLEDRVDRSADMRALRRALAAGKTVLFPQIHQVLPRLARVMVALRVLFIESFREECSFLFAVHGRGLPGMRLHHDGDVESFWLQLEGQRTVTIGPPVAAGTPQRLAGPPAGRRPGWTTLALAPGTLFYMPPRSPHQVICHGRSLAVTMTWSRRRRPARGRASALERARRDASALTVWDVVSGHAETIPRPSRRRLWTQVPATAGPVDPETGTFPLWVAGSVPLVLPARSHPLASRLGTMPSLPVAGGRAARAARAPLIADGVLAPRDLPMRIIPQNPRALDGWRFA